MLRVAVCLAGQPRSYWVCYKNIKSVFVGKIYNLLYESTKADLVRWGVKFDELVFGKIFFDLLIDDKAFNVSELDRVDSYIR